MDRSEYRAPIYYGKPHPARLQFPANWQLLAEPVRMHLSDSSVEKLTVVIPEGFDGSWIEFPGLEKTVTDVFVQVDRLDGSSFTTIARPVKSWLILRGERAWIEYLGLGLQHILLGIDHLLFVLGLLLLVASRSRLVKTIPLPWLTASPSASAPWDCSICPCRR